MYYQSNTAAALQFPYTAMSSEELTEPFPGKRTRKYPKNRNESLIFCGMLVHAA